MCILITSFHLLLLFFNADCEVQYLKEPPTSLNCNPFINRELFLECKIRFYSNFLTEPQVLVEWHYSRQNNSDSDPRSVERLTVNSSRSKIHAEALNTSLLDHSMENVDIQREVVIDSNIIKIKSTLKIYALNESDIGYYWCSVHLNNSNVTSNVTLLPSSLLLLEHPQMYNLLNSCDTNAPKSQEGDTSCYMPTSPSLPTLPPTTPGSSQLGNETEVFDPTTLRYVKQSTPTAQPSTDQEEDKLKMKHLREFYIAIGIVVAFGSVIAALGLIVAYTCVKYRRMLKGIMHDQQK